jgi:hypothetical protein
MKPRRLTRHAPCGCPTPRRCWFMIPLTGSCGDASRECRLREEQDPRSRHCKGSVAVQWKDGAIRWKVRFRDFEPTVARTCRSSFFRRWRWEQSLRQPRVPPQDGPEWVRTSPSGSAAVGQRRVELSRSSRAVSGLLRGCSRSGLSNGTPIHRRRRWAVQ